MGAKGVANAEKVADTVKLGSRIVGDGGALLLSGGQAVESAKQVYTNITNGEGLTWKNAVDVIALGISVAGMGMAGASIAKSGKSLKAMYKGETAVSNVATSNATKGVSQARENAGQMKMDLQLFGGKSGSGTRNIYRAVGADEYQDIMSTHKFRGIEGTFAAKEFGNSFDETLTFANKSINKDKVAIIKVTIPENIYNQLHHMELDAYIFKSGTPIVEPDMLDVFNKNIIRIEHVY